MKQLLLRLARTRIAHRSVGWIFTHMRVAIPVERLRETSISIAFHHPQPSHSFHVLLVPKRPFSSLLAVPQDATDFLQDLVATVQSLVREHHLEDSGYRLITNREAYQDVPHLHFHLIADESVDKAS